MQTAGAKKRHAHFKEDSSVTACEACAPGFFADVARPFCASCSAGRYAEAAEKLSEALEMLPESTMYAADRKLLTLSRDRAVTRRDEEAAKDAAEGAGADDDSIPF